MRLTDDSRPDPYAYDPYAYAAQYVLGSSPALRDALAEGSGKEGGGGGGLEEHQFTENEKTELETAGSEVQLALAGVVLSIKFRLKHPTAAAS